MPVGMELHVVWKLCVHREGNNRRYSEEYTDELQLIRTYHHPYTVTLDELPDLKG